MEMLNPILGWLGLIAFAALVVLVAVGLLNVLWSPRWRERRPDPALEALDLRYARGEIGREEYLRMKRDLQQG